ncbi:MAG: hypothetical protein GX469_09180 [Treponema sp.]|nr:hypothetical protein [Treponema sp.]
MNHRKKSDYSTKEKLHNYIYVNGTNNLENIRLPDATSSPWTRRSPFCGFGAVAGRKRCDDGR